MQPLHPLTMHFDWVCTLVQGFTTDKLIGEEAEPLFYTYLNNIHAWGGFPIKISIMYKINQRNFFPL